MQQDPIYLKSPMLRQVRIANMANPTWVPEVAQMVSSTKRQQQRAAGYLLNRLSSISYSRKNAKNVQVSKYLPGTSLWMTQTLASASDEESGSFYVSERYLAGEGNPTQTWLDLQTNNSKREYGAVDSRKKSPDSSEYDFASDVSETSIPMNKNAMARGADAMVKNSLSRQTEIIDTSKLAEEGKVETEYEAPEVIEEQDRAMIDEYEKTFAYARRLRALLNMDFKQVDKGAIETNFLLVKAHEHPTQKMTERWRRVDLGEPYNDQLKRQKLIDDFRANSLKKKGKSAKDDATPQYPDMLRFSVRFRKDNSEKRWNDYLAFRQQQKKSGGSKDAGPLPKANDKYVFAYQDIWSFSIAVFVRPWANVREIIDPVFSRLGLERRADFTYTIGTFIYDKRAGKAKIAGVPNGAEQLEMYTIASELYKKNCTEIYVNDNRCEMFLIFPDYYNNNVLQKPADSKKNKPDSSKKKKDTKNDKNAKDAKDAKNGNAVVADNKNKSNATPYGDEKSQSTGSLLSRLAGSTQPTPTLLKDEALSELRGSALLLDEAAAFEDSAAMSSNCRVSLSQQPYSVGRRLTISDNDGSFISQ